MARRALNNAGSVYKDKRGRWIAAVSAGGRRRFRVARTRADAERLRRELLQLVEEYGALPPIDERQTVRDYLTSWLEAARPSLRPRTHESYEILVRRHALPRLGALRLRALTPQHLQRLYAAELADGLAPQTVRNLHRVLHRALTQAVQWRLIPRNAGDAVTAPRPSRTEMRALTPAEARTLLDAARGDRLEALYVLAVTTGMRRGELLALTWADVDLDEATLRVTATLQRTAAGFTRAEPKTVRSRRLVLLTPAAVASLRERRTHGIAERLRAGGAWDDRWGLVFSTSTGRPMDGSNLIGRSFRPLVARAGVPRVRFHDLRHTCATLLLSRGVHAKVVSDLLGHSTIAITLDTYSHVLPPMQRQAAEAMAGILDGSALGG